MHKPEWRTIVVRPYTEHDCEFDVYIGDQKCSREDGEVYRFDVPCDFHETKRIRIVVKKGYLCLDDSSSVGRYNLLFNDRWTTIDIHQSGFVKWFQHDHKKLPLIIKENETVEFDHVVPNGPSYFEMKFNYPMKPIGRDVEENTKSVLENYRMKNE
jgi:hypothetical protein